MAGEEARTALLRAVRKRKLDEAFAGKKFDVVRSVHLPLGQVFETMFGNKGRHGYVIRDLESGEEYVVGMRILRLIHDEYQGVTLPETRRRPKTDAAG